MNVSDLEVTVAAVRDVAVATTQDPLLVYYLSDPERMVIGLYYTLILLLCWTGNSFILYATITHRLYFNSQYNVACTF